MKVVQLNTEECAPHPLLERMPMRPELAKLLTGDAAAAELEAWDAFCVDVAVNRVKDPVTFAIGPDGKPQIIRGRHRWRASSMAGHKTIPGFEVSQDEVNAEILRDAGQRLNAVGKSGAAYLAVRLLPHLMAAKPGRKAANCRNTSQLTQTDAAALVGCARELINQACELARRYDSEPVNRAKFEPLVLAGKLSIGAAIAGLAGAVATAGKDRRPTGFPSASKTLSSLTSRLRGFDKWPPEDRADAPGFIAAQVAEWPQSVRELFAEALNAGGPDA